MSDTTRLLITVNPTLALEWNIELNTLDLQTIYANSGKKAHWTCNTCDYAWKAVIASRNSSGRGCPRCAGKVSTAENALESLYPAFAKQYFTEKNKRPLSEITIGSSTPCWWKCDQGDDHIWKTSPANRVRQNLGCPMCSGRFATKENNLAVAYPTLAAEFDLVKNTPLTPSQVTPKSSKKLHWKCAKGHSWKTAPATRVNPRSYDRAKRIGACPYCVGHKVSEDNNLAVTHPEIAAEWHPTLNQTQPSEHRYGNKSKVWWKCSVDPKHVWHAAINSRTSRWNKFDKLVGCPECSPTPRTSKLEGLIRETLEEQSILTDIPTTYNAFIPVEDGKRSAAVDVYGVFQNNLKVVVEYDSWYWHSGVAFKEHAKDEAPEVRYATRAARDIRKTQQLLDSGYTVIRIREVCAKTTLPLLHMNHPALVQIAWKQSEGIDLLCTKVKESLTALLASVAESETL